MVEDYDLGRFFELTTSNIKYVIRLKLHEIKNVILKDFISDFELIRFMLIGELEQNTRIRFKDEAIGVDYDIEDVIFTGCLYKLNTPVFMRVNRAQYGRGTDFKKDFVKIFGKIYYISTNGPCFIKCIIHRTGKEYTDESLTFIRIEQKRPETMTTAKIQAYCKKQ